MLTALAERESAFDEGEPPALAVATGRVATGHGGTGDGGTGHGGGAGFVVGPAVQLVDSLLRETAPGDLVMPRPVHTRVEERLQAGGIAAAEQRGLLSPQPLFVLHEAAARRIAAELAPVAPVAGAAEASRVGSSSPTASR